MKAVRREDIKGVIFVDEYMARNKFIDVKDANLKTVFPKGLRNPCYKHEGCYTVDNNKFFSSIEELKEKYHIIEE